MSTRKTDALQGRWIALLTCCVVVVSACGGSPGARSAGRMIERPLETHWNSYKFQDDSIMADELGAAIKGQPTLTQVGAIEAALTFTKSLEDQQRVQTNAETTILAAMEKKFPDTKPILDKEVRH